MSPEEASSRDGAQSTVDARVAVIRAGAADLLNALVRPKRLLPARVVEGLAINERDELLGLDFAQGRYQRAKTRGSDLRVCDQSSTSIRNCGWPVTRVPGGVADTSASRDQVGRRCLCVGIAIRKLSGPKLLAVQSVR
jgi:hypothetical protein